jgi:anti-sigma factor RsiW
MKPHDAAGARCRGLLEQLSRYIDGDLAGVERRTITMHLRRCPCCAELAHRLERTVETCREAGHRRLPSDVRARARARIEELLGH